MTKLGVTYACLIHLLTAHNDKIHNDEIYNDEIYNDEIRNDVLVYLFVSF